MDQKTNFRSFIYSHNSTKSAKLANIGPVDIEIIGVKSIKITKINKKRDRAVLLLICQVVFLKEGRISLYCNIFLQ